MADNEKLLSDSFPWETIDDDIDRWIEEDLGRGDITSDFLPIDGMKIEAEVVAHSYGVLAGIDGFERILRKADPDLRVISKLSDGTAYESGDTLITFVGDAKAVLHVERTALNLLNHLSGVASLTAKFVENVKGTNVKILDTRKTIPGLRELEKYAVRCGGGVNHRLDLSSAVLIKDNHLVLIDSKNLTLSKIIRAYREKVGHGVKIEVEAGDLNRVGEAVEAGADIVMLDNMTPDQAREAVKLHGTRIILEISGGVTLENVREWAETGVDIISIGALTHSVKSADNSLEFVKDKSPDSIKP